MSQKKHVMKCNAMNTHFLPDSISIDVLIKINYINFIWGRNLLNKNKLLSTLECCNVFSTAVKNFYKMRCNF